MVLAHLLSFSIEIKTVTGEQCAADFTINGLDDAIRDSWYATCTTPITSVKPRCSKLEGDEIFTFKHLNIFNKSLECQKIGKLTKVYNIV